MILRAFAKINWSLDITGERPDGYHIMDMVMQPVSLADEITLTPSDGLSIETSGYPPCAADESNLAYRAAELLRESFCVKNGTHIILKKNIPMGAGLGGGSADAAAVLFGLNILWNLNLSPETLRSIGLSLGADIPFCLCGGLTRTRGIGEDLEKHEYARNYWLLIFQPCKALSTKTVFSAWRKSQNIIRPDTENVLRALRDGNNALLSSSIGNVLESVSGSFCPEIPEAVFSLKASGAFAAGMSGSGSAVFGVFSSEDSALEAKKILSQRYNRIFLCHTQSDSIQIAEERY